MRKPASPLRERRLSLRDDVEPRQSIWQSIANRFGVFGLIGAFIFASIGFVSLALGVIFVLAKYA